MADIFRALRESGGLGALGGALQAGREAELGRVRGFGGQMETIMNIKKFQREEATAAAEQAKLAKQAELDAEPIPLDLIISAFRQAGMPGNEEFITEQFMDANLARDVGGEIVTSRGEASTAREFLESNIDLIGKMNENSLSFYSKKTGELKLQIAEEDNPEKLQKLEEEFMRLTKLKAPFVKFRAEQEIKAEVAPSGGEIPAGMKDFELTTFGRLVPGKRGTQEYIQARLGWIRKQKEQSTFVDAFVRKEANSIRKEFSGLADVKQAIESLDKFEIMERAFSMSHTEENLGAIDQALITIFNKMTDPGSVVRESEYERVPQGIPLFNKIKGKIAKIRTGGAGLTPDDRKAIFKLGEVFKDVNEQKLRDRTREYRGYIAAIGVDPTQFLGGVQEPQVQEPPEGGITFSDAEIQKMRDKGVDEETIKLLTGR